MKILLLGKDGQVGSELQRSLLPLGELIAIGRRELDLTDLTALAALLITLTPDIIVNAAAYTNVDNAEEERAAAFLLNAEMVNTLAEYAQKSGSMLVHYSTDYVFDGKAPSAYVETDPVNPQNIYGLSKLAGEQAIVASDCNFLIFRTSWVFSPLGNNFIKNILKFAQEKESLAVVSDQQSSPTSAELIADITALAIVTYQQGRIASGIYHLSSTGITSRHNLACYVVTHALEQGIHFKLSLSKIMPLETLLFPQRAKRPKNSLLNTTRLSTALNMQFPNWSIDVKKVIGQLIGEGYFNGM
ncbi:dTDP-4-dehydrorhamnose reductase [soil metagenome]